MVVKSVSPTNRDYLARVYLGRRRITTAPSANVTLRNFNLHLDQMIELGLPIQKMAGAISEALALVHCGGPSLHSWSEIWGRYAISTIVWMMENQASSVDGAQRPLIWEGGGRGYFVNEHGRQAVNMPWTSDVYHAMVLQPNLQDYNVQY
ncbi:hypothetical protein N7490_008252 [Penicillium lividum]|nr:hypothetical protein N7490_008252 [Penicillium lividum]